MRCVSKETAKLVFRGSSAVEQPAVNRLVVGSNPTRGANFGLSDPDVRHQGKTSSRKML
jgi:hypothetical protein